MYAIGRPREPLPEREIYTARGSWHMAKGGGTVSRWLSPTSKKAFLARGECLTV